MRQSKISKISSKFAIKTKCEGGCPYTSVKVSKCLKKCTFIFHSQDLVNTELPTYLYTCLLA